MVRRSHQPAQPRNGSGPEPLDQDGPAARSGVPELNGHLHQQRQRRAHAETAGKFDRHLTLLLVKAPAHEGPDRR